jgi:hypothetical protein
MRRISVLITLCLAALLGGCSSTSPLDVAVPLNVSAGSQSLLLQNPTGRPIYYLVLESNFAALANWYQCADPDTCPRVEARSQVRVDYEDIAGYEPGDKRAIVYWWHAEQVDGKWTAGRLHSVGVPL